MKNIVVGIDFSTNSINAMRHAVAIALKSGGTIHLVWVKTPGVTQNVTKENGANYVKKADQQLQEAVKMCKNEAPDCDVRGLILEGKASQQLISFVSNLEDALLVIGTHGVSGFEDFFVGSNTLRAITLSKKPILILREGVNINRDLINIIAPIDTSFETLQKIKYAITYAQIFNAKVLLVGLMNKSKEDQHTVTVQLKHARNMCDEANIRYEETHLKVGDNAMHTLIDFAVKEEANLMVVMRENDGMNDTWLTSSTNQLINEAPMPMLIIPNVASMGVTK